MPFNHAPPRPKRHVSLSPPLPLWQTDPVQYLINEKYQLSYLLKGNSSQLDENTVRDIAAFRVQLEAMKQVDIAQLVQDAKNREAERTRLYREKVEAQAFFNQPAAIADFGQWARLSYWTLEEAVALSKGRNPKIVNSTKLKAYKGNSPFVADYLARLDEVMRAKQMGVLWASTLPSLFVAWAARINFGMPPELVERVTEFGSHVVDWKKAFENKVIEAKELREKVAEANQQLVEARADHMKSLTKTTTDLDDLGRRQQKALAAKDATIAKQFAEIASLKSEQTKGTKAKKTELGPRERDSLLKLVLGLAIGGYGYDPKPAKSRHTKEIANDLRLRGIPLDEGTILKFLNEAKTEFGNQLIEQDDS